MFGHLIPLAVTMQSGKGCLALLLGSGVSRSAGIPTGWEVTLELIRRVAAAEGQDAGADPEAWFRDKYHTDPDYSNLLKQLAPTPASRQALLRGFFEPNAEEREQGIKMPSAAHRAVADLVQSGAVRVIVTTNFDRLLELALQDAGITPTVVTNDDSRAGAAPLPHTPCTIMKVHGDYLDSRIKNSPAELASYSPAMTRLLDRVFEDYGLIVCGWSGECDTALIERLRKAERAPYPVYWLMRGEPGPAAREIIATRHAIVVPIDGAETFLPDLAERVRALDDLAGGRPLTAQAAVAMIKRLMAEPRFEIRLHDFLTAEFARSIAQIRAANILTGEGPWSGAEFQRRLAGCEHVMQVPAALYAAAAYWGCESRGLQLGFERYWPLCPDSLAGRSDYLDLAAYPAVLAFYAAGIAGVLAGRFDLLAGMSGFAEGHPRRWPEDADGKPLPWAYLASANLPFLSLARDRPAVLGFDCEPAASKRIFGFLRPLLSEYGADDAAVVRAFDRFEYLVALLHADFLLRLETNSTHQLLRFVPIGAYVYRRRTVYRSQVAGPAPPDGAPAETRRDIVEQGERWPPLAAGLFGRDSPRAQKAADYVDQSFAQRNISL